MENAFYEAYRRWMEDYCAPSPDQLNEIILRSARDGEAAVSEIDRRGKARWPMAVFVYSPYGKPLGHPDLEAIWAASGYDLSVLMHTFTVAPVGLDIWDNLWLQRSAAHP